MTPLDHLLAVVADESVSLEALAFLEYGADLVRRAAVRRVELHDVDDLLPLVAANPALAGLTGLTLRGRHYWERGDGRALAASPHVAGLTELELNSYGEGDDIAEELAASPRLAGLTTLRLVGCGLGDRGARALAASPHLASLVTLDLRDNSDLGSAGVGVLVASPALPRLTTLDVRGLPCFLSDLHAPAGCPVFVPDRDPDVERLSSDLAPWTEGFVVRRMVADGAGPRGVRVLSTPAAYDPLPRYWAEAFAAGATFPYWSGPITLRPCEPIDPDAARARVEKVLATEQVYRSRRMAAAAAADLAARFLALFHEPLYCFGAFGAGHTFGVGVIIVCPTRAGLFYLGEED